MGGRVAPDAIDAPAWADPVWAFEVRLEPTMAVVSVPHYRPLPAYPAMERDAALLVPEATAAARVEAVIRSAGGPLWRRRSRSTCSAGGTCRRVSAALRSACASARRIEP